MPPAVGKKKQHSGRFLSELMIAKATSRDTGQVTAFTMPGQDPPCLARGTVLETALNFISLEYLPEGRQLFVSLSELSTA